MNFLTSGMVQYVVMYCEPFAIKLDLPLFGDREFINVTIEQM